MSRSNSHNYSNTPLKNRTSRNCEKEALYNSIIITMSEGIVVQNKSGEIIECNSRAEMILGLTRSQMTGRKSIDPRWKAVHEDGSDFPGETHPAMVTLKTGLPQRNIVMGVYKPNGELTWILINSQTVINQENNQLDSVVTTFVDITDYSKVKFEATLMSSRLINLIQNIQAGILLENEKREIIFVNQMFCDIFQIPATPEQLLGADCSNAANDASYLIKNPTEFVDLINNILLNKKIVLNDEVKFLNGKVFERDYIPIYVDQLYRGHLWQYRDVTTKIEANKSFRLAATVIENVNEAIIVTDVNVIVMEVNSAFTNITGYRKDEIIGKKISLISSGKHDKNFYKEMWSQISSNGKWEGELWNRRKDGDVFPAWLSISSIKDDHNNVLMYTAVLTDITGRKKYEESIKHKAYHDALTNLPNRDLFIDRLEMHIRQAYRDNLKLALLFIDLDGFKQINDTHGHYVGDILLQQVANRLTCCIRDGDSVARLGGDEFTILLPKIEKIESAFFVAEKLLDMIKEPFNIEGIVAKIGASIGIAIYPDHGSDVQSLMNQADKMMYQVKKSGKNSYLVANNSSF